MKTHTRKELKIARARLVKAKPIAIELYPDFECIWTAFDRDWVNAGMTFDSGGRWLHDSSAWVIKHATCKADIARVFDNSIALLDKRIAALKG